MKKIIILFFLVVLTQELKAQGFDADLLIGANFSQVDGDALAGYNKLGLNAGIAISRKVNDEWDIGFELLYSVKGARNVIDPDIGGVPIKLKWNYVEVPIVATYSLTKDVEFVGGPSIGVNILGERQENGISVPVEGLQPIEIGLTLGASYYFSDRLGLALRHSYSMISVRDFPISAGPTGIGRAGWYNRLFTVGVRYHLQN